MRTELALKHIKSRAKELGWREVEIQLRHVKANPGANQIKAGSDLWLLIEEQDLREPSGAFVFPGSAVRVESLNGVFDLLDIKISEQEHEHSGTIGFTNKTARVLFVMFLQVTPKRKKKHGKAN